MNDYTKTKIKNCLKDYCDQVLKKDAKNDFMYYSPSHNEKTASFSINKNNPTFAKDFSTSKDYDIFSLYAELNGLDNDKDFTQIATALAKQFNILLDNDDYNKGRKEAQQIKTEIKETEEKQQQDFTEYYKSLGDITQHQEAIDYLKSRCITEAEIKKYNILYDKSKQAIIIPCNNYYYKGRTINPDNYIKHINPKNAAVKLWNEEILKDSDTQTNIFITESITDALSIETAKAEAKTIALNSTSNKQLLYDAVKKYDYKGYFILCLDADESGIKASQELHTELEKMGFYSYIANKNLKAYGDEITTETEENGLKIITHKAETKDLNEFVIKYEALGRGKNFVKSFFEMYEEEANTEFKKYLLQDLTPTTEYIEKLESDIKHTDIYKPTPTKIRIFDEALNGGLFAKQVICLVAGTSLGKTAFALQIADNIASDKPVLYFSLEMSQSELIARSISRKMSEWTNEDGTSYTLNQLDILQGKQYNSTQYLEAYQRAREDYKMQVKGNLFIYECLDDGENTIEAITKKIANYIAKTKQKPVIFIDYLQYIDANIKNGTDKQGTDKIIREIKKTSRKYEIPIFVISSTARGKDKKELEIDSGKNSGDIEYTSDILIGLNNEAVADAKTDSKGNLKQEDKQKQKQARKQTTRDIYLTILKNRNGKRDIDIKGIQYTPHLNLYDFEKAYIN